jgi:hypothetical protein
MECLNFEHGLVRMTYLTTWGSCQLDAIHSGGLAQSACALWWGDSILMAASSFKHFLLLFPSRHFLVHHCSLLFWKSRVFSAHSAQWPA